MPNGEVLMVNVYLGSTARDCDGYSIYNPAPTPGLNTQVRRYNCGTAVAGIPARPAMSLADHANAQRNFFATGASECEAGNIATYNWSTNTWTAQGTFPNKNAANDAPARRRSTAMQS